MDSAYCNHNCKKCNLYTMQIDIHSFSIKRLHKMKFTFFPDTIHIITKNVKELVFPSLVT